MPSSTPPFRLLEAPRWQDYELLDSGDGLKLERFGKYLFARPESQAMWRRARSSREWESAHAIFHPTAEESGGHWEARQRLPERWEMRYALPNSKELKFFAMITPGRHLGVFPETAAHWDFMAEKIEARARQNGGEEINVLNLFGYTGIASLAAAATGARVTHVDASKKSVSWARENQALSGLSDKPIRWIVDDALKFAEREARRGVKYDGVILDPPKFGRGPKGEVWEVYQSLPSLLQACRACLSEKPLFFIVTMYAVRASALHVAQALAETTHPFKGELECGELTTREKSANRLLSQAVYARWGAR